jgi:acetyltransferase-like isoleucine patch superfamily enzyme
MAISIFDNGSNNEIVIPNHIPDFYNINIKISGNNNKIYLSNAFSSAGTDIILEHDNEVIIGNDVKLEFFFIYAAREGRVIIEDGVSCNGINRILVHEPGSVEIGAGCLFAGGTDISVSDMHPIFDKLTGKRVNPAKNVSLEKRVWIGQDAKILKGSHIGHDSIIGAAAVVTGAISAESIAAGNPAKVVKSGVVWRHSLTIATL